MSLRQEQRLTYEQRLEIRTRQLQLRLELIQMLHDEDYKPKAECPECRCQLTPIQIISGFNRDPQDYTTCCPNCKHRFKAILVCGDRLGVYTELPFYCASQTLAQLPGKEALSSDDFKKKEPAIFHSAIVHFGSLHKAFSSAGIDYPHKEVDDWKGKALPFLGQMPDTVIADYIGVPVSAVRKMRKKQGIPRFIFNEG